MPSYHFLDEYLWMQVKCLESLWYIIALESSALAEAVSKFRIIVPLYILSWKKKIVISEKVLRLIFHSNIIPNSNLDQVR
jgi:hypothetical protein